MIPTRADRCCHVLYSIQSRDRAREHWVQGAIAAFTESRNRSQMEAALGRTLDPIAGGPATGKSLAEILNLFVDDFFGTGGNEMEQRVLTRLREQLQVGSEDWNDVAFTGQGIRWTQDSKNRAYIEVNQNKAIEELEEIPVERNTEEDLHCTPSMHTMYTSLLGQINLIRTQFQCCYKFSRCASMADSTTIGDVKSLNKLARQIKSQPVNLQYWPPTGPLRILGFPDASYRSNDDGSSQRGMTVFLAESRVRSSRGGMTYGSLIGSESLKVKKTVLSTTVAELYSFMKCFGSCQFLRGLWMDISVEVANIHMRTDAKNVVTTGRTVHLPEQMETIHMISMLRKEAPSRSIHDLAHIPTQKLLDRLPHKDLSQGGQTVHSCADRKTA